MKTSFQWFPFLPEVYYVALAVAALLIMVLALWRRMPDAGWRGVFALVLMAVLLNPVLSREDRSGLPDKVVIVVDESLSQKIGERDKVADDALRHVLAKVDSMPGLEPLVIRAGTDARGLRGDGTYLFTQMRDSLMSIPLSQVAGTILITDGQVHDVPDALGPLDKIAPVHALLTGRKGEFDRKVTIITAPKYGVLDETVRVTLRVEEFGRTERRAIPLQVMQDGKVTSTINALPGELHYVSFKIKHPGQNIFEFVIPVEEGELTPHNNRAPVIVNGIRDRLRVLLVSDAPHMGKRAWRNLLKSDAAIDLVHFTILRNMTSVDSTPQNEMSLIAFPVDELFNRRIKDFDLIIFDRYQQYGFLLPHYFNNIVSFINGGGAFLLALGTQENDQMLFNSALGKVMPVQLGGLGSNDVLKKTFRPALTPEGKTHPITADLERKQAADKWGPWHTSINMSKLRGTTLMNGLDGRPLMVIDKVGDGRVGVLGSDNIWLWAKGNDTTRGPYTEFLRNLSHWLMKEPELEEDYIKAEAYGYVITISQRTIAGAEAKSVKMTAPDGSEKTIKTENRIDGGWMVARETVEQSGIYKFSNGAREAYVVVGASQSVEFNDVHTTEDILAPLVRKSGGEIIWYQEQPDLALRLLSADAREGGGSGWLGLRRNNAYTVDSVSTAALLPNGWMLLILLVGMVAVWWREGGKRS